jgi:hypothetical protein
VTPIGTATRFVRIRIIGWQDCELRLLVAICRLIASLTKLGESNTDAVKQEKRSRKRWAKVAAAAAEVYPKLPISQAFCGLG